MTTNTYRLKVRHDQGITWFVTAATGEDQAKQIVCEAENCPRSAILKVLDTQFYNKDGSLTRYGLKCGYIERKETTTQWKELYREHNAFHVRMGNRGQRLSLWETFDSWELTKARKLYRSIKLQP